MLRRFGANPRGQFAYLFERLSPQGEDIRVPAGHADCGIGSTAEKDGNMWLLDRLHFRKGLLELIIFSVMVERLLFGPDAPQYFQIFVSTGIAIIVVQVIAITPLFAVGTAGNDVHT